MIFLADGNIHDELTLGKYNGDQKEKSSERKGYPIGLNIGGFRDDVLEGNIDIMLLFD